jgi:hypothetical protein
MLYQQNQKIEVIVRKVDETMDLTGANETSAEDTAQAEGEISSVKSNSSARRKKRVIITNATHILAVGKQTVGLAINYRISTVGARYGDEALQDNVQRNWEIFDDSLSVVSSFGMGAVYGAWGGPIGAAIGALTNTASTVVSIAAKYKKREFEYSTKMFKEENGIEYLRARASINMTSGRLR